MKRLKNVLEYKKQRKIKERGKCIKSRKNRQGKVMKKGKTINRREKGKKEEIEKLEFFFFYRFK